MMNGALIAVETRSIEQYRSDYCVLCSGLLQLLVIAVSFLTVL